MKKGGLSVDQYIAAISKKADEVRDAGIFIEDEELTLFALDDLDSSYDAFVTAVTATTKDLSFSEFKGLLKAHEKCILREASLPSPSANFTQKFQNQINAGQLSNSSLVNCQIYNKRGHTAIICFNRHNESQYLTSNDQNRRGNYTGRPSYGKSPNANAGWYADLGCTNHTTNNKNNLAGKDATKKEAGLTIANGNLISVDNTGNSIVRYQNHTFMLKGMLHAPEGTTDCGIRDSLYHLELEKLLPTVNVAEFVSTWHNRLDHLNH